MMHPKTDWTDKDLVIRTMRNDSPPKTWEEIASTIGVTRETVRMRAKTMLRDCYEEKHPQLNR